MSANVRHHDAALAVLRAIVDNADRFAYPEPVASAFAALADAREAVYVAAHAIEAADVKVAAFYRDNVARRITPAKTITPTSGETR